MSAAASAYPFVLRPVARRAVHIRILPRPPNLAASRQILRILSQFGEVEHFRSLKYDALCAPNTALAIFKDERTAEIVRRRCPIRFKMGKAQLVEQDQSVDVEQEGQDEQVDSAYDSQDGLQETDRSAAEAEAEQIEGQDHVDTSLPGQSQQPRPMAPWGLGDTGQQTRSMSTNTSRRSPVKWNSGNVPSLSHPLAAPISPPSADVIYQIEAGPARMRFRDVVNQGHYHGSFPLDTKSAAQEDLIRKVPLAGLSCWNWKAQGKPWRLTEKHRNHLRATQEGGEKTLRELYEEGKAARPASAQTVNGFHWEKLLIGPAAIRASSKAWLE